MCGSWRPPERDRLRVVLFSGGRGSAQLTRQLLRDSRVHLTLAINGYDDGASTGEVRRFLGDSLGPSDFRKNASRVAHELKTCPATLIGALDERLPAVVDVSGALRRLERCAADHRELEPYLFTFLEAFEASGRPFEFRDCAIGNLVFAGAFLRAARDFNAAVDAYSGVLGLAPGLIENVTAGENGHLVAVADDGRVLPTEADIVGGRPASIRDLFVLPQPLTASDLTALDAMPPDGRIEALAARQVRPRLNVRLATTLADADLIVYAPGTQHSSLFPSYLAIGMGETIAANLRAIKLLVTNIESDVEIAGADATTLIRKAGYYLTARGTRPVPTALLFTHCVINDPGAAVSDRPYVPLGALDTVEDPRLIRIGQFEDGVSGRHDAARLLEPIVSSLRPVDSRLRVAIVLERATSPNLLTQTLLELVRGGLGNLPLDVLVLHEGASLPHSFTAALPFALAAVARADQLRSAVEAHQAEYVAVLDSSGMYRGEDLVSLLAQVRSSRLDAVWGSRRLSLRDIDASVQMRYSKAPLAAWVSRAGSEMLSLACLIVHGRYVSDTLSGIRVYRAAALRHTTVPPTEAMANHQVLAWLLAQRAELIEMPVQFLPLSPARVRRTTTWDGLRALWTLIRPPHAGAAAPASSGTRARGTDELIMRGHP